ncbi:MAG: hypothetical protein AAF337_10675 [Pseudomonadota bacterium]
MQKTSPSSARPLSASLLVNKGAARPAPVFGQRAPSSSFEPATEEAPQSDTTVQAPVEAPVSTYSEPPAEQAEPVAVKKAAFTFRMDERRHFRLRLLSAHQNRSSQKIMEAALDAYLDTHAPQTSGMACPCFSDEV